MSVVQTRLHCCCPLSISGGTGLERTVAGVQTLQEHVRLAETRPPIHVEVPAGRHQVVGLARAPGRPLRVHAAPAARVTNDVTTHDVTASTCRRAHALQVGYDVSVAERGERALICVGQDLPQSDAERPDITTRRVLALQPSNIHAESKQARNFTVTVCSQTLLFTETYTEGCIQPVLFTYPRGTEGCVKS